ncbi:glucan endo-1,3-beta-D-glucosidase [Sediminicola luteus]|uniref:Glucan endo-1,3-beta-D-glucosidase n=1 Tax=Sediminicola luteus TaxID=319238 RepID=A0ABV2TSD2_9FLAO
MKDMISKYSALLLVFFALMACQEDEPTLDTFLVPTNIQVNINIVGADQDNPNGDGSGKVEVTATADNAISYQFVYNGVVTTSPNGKITFEFSETGLKTYNFTVVAVGAGGILSSSFAEADVLVTYSPPADLLTMLTSNSSRTWRIKAEVDGHFGLGPVGGSIPNEFFPAPANDKAATGMYDDRYTFNVNGTFTHDTGVGETVFGRVGLIDELGPHSETPNGADIENYPLADNTAQWSLSAPGGLETLSLTGKAFMGYYVGGDHKYEFFSRSENEMWLKTTDGNNEFDWWFILIAE